uniref:Uncharacterized protein n=1 Tax=Arundo donax TaxID=35708 RepID=A0A0A9BC01_ARUDO
MVADKHGKDGNSGIQQRLICAGPVAFFFMAAQLCFFHRPDLMQTVIAPTTMYGNARGR